jgi:hypothetical protein
LYSFGLLLLTVIDLRELFSFGGRSCALGCSIAYARSWPKSRVLVARVRPALAED